MASVRVVNVGGVEYLQVAEYRRVDGQPRVEIVKSFGRESIENRLRAEQFAAEYDRLRRLALEHARQGNAQATRDSFQNSALATFGLILGAAIVIGLLNEVVGKD